MKFATQKLLLAATSGALALLLAGCPKTPQRPTPIDTSTQIRTPLPDTGMAPTSIGNLNPEAPDLRDRPPGWGAGGENPEILAAHTVYFDYDQHAIKASERTKLQAAKSYLDQNPTHKLLLEGRCDWRGTEEYNLGLGDRRANAAKRYLQSLGVAVNRLETVSKGSLEAAKNADDATRAKDRRVNLIVVDPARATGGPRPL